MKIHNVRAGFATNSSSSHSVILVGDDHIENDRAFSEYYGWENFTLSTPEDKVRYLCAQAFSGSLDSDDFKMFVEIVTAESGIEPDIPSGENLDLSEYRCDFGVDHQSKWFVPKDEVSVRALVRHMMNPSLVVLGGNDNSDGHPLSEKYPKDPISDALAAYSHKTKMRVDGPYIIAFDSNTGNKVRVSIDKNAPDYTKSCSPELVDLKITDWCDLGCKFCYQGSTTKGRHAKKEDIFRIVDMLAEANVFEIALGGGEPTSHPDFAEILEYISASGMVANFTTRTTRWLEDNTISDAVQQHVGAIGVSCLSAKDLHLVEELRVAVRPWAHDRVIAQHVLGSVPLGVTGEFLDAAFAKNQHVLLLGYKTVGFGATFERHDHGEVAVYLKMCINKHENPRMSVDTALVDQHPDLIAALEVPKVLVTSPEGKFSCYIDAVAKSMGPSSYVDPTELSLLPMKKDNFLDLFATY